MERVLAANIELATREGHAPRPQAIEAARKRLMDPQGLWSASMLRDMEGGGSVEADHIVGWMLERARKHGLDDTCCRSRTRTSRPTSNGGPRKRLLGN
jgi:2-dehydropantoate 2-reductase